jgi:hypothetical protein
LRHFNFPFSVDEFGIILENSGARLKHRMGEFGAKKYFFVGVKFSQNLAHNRDVAQQLRKEIK